MFRGLLAGPQDEAVGWLLARVVDQAEAEQRALLTLERWDHTRREALEGLRRDAAALALLDHLWEEPAVTVRGVADRLGVSATAARAALAVLLKSGIVRGVPAWQDDATPPRQTVARPLAYLAVEFVTTRRPPPRRKRVAEPAAGAPMH